AARRAAGAEREPSQRRNQPAFRRSVRRERAAGKIMGIIKSKQQARSLAWGEKVPRKALKRGKEVEKITTTLECGGNVLLPFRVPDGPVAPEGFLFANCPTRWRTSAARSLKRAPAREGLALFSRWRFGLV